jgi:hypothetical protein
MDKRGSRGSVKVSKKKVEFEKENWKNGFTQGVHAGALS